jgi:hypothetical protein
MTEITHIQPGDRISQGPSQIKDIVLKILSHCAGETFPTTDNSDGRLAYITLGSPLTDGLGPLAGWICVYRSPDWQRVFHVNDVPLPGSEVAAALATKQAVINGPASTALTGTFGAGLVLVTNAQGKLAVSAITATQLAALNGVSGSATIQEQLDGKQPTIVARTVEPGPADNTYPDDTVWLVYIP